MGSGKSSLDNSQWRPNKRRAGIPRARRPSRVAPVRRRFSNRVIRASLARLASRLARASRRLARRDARPRLRPRAALDRRARSPRSIDDARVDVPQHPPAAATANSRSRTVCPYAVRARDDRPACRERRRGARQKTARPWSRAVRRRAWERTPWRVDAPLGARARDERRGARDDDAKRRDDDARDEFENFTRRARMRRRRRVRGSRSSGRGTRRGARETDAERGDVR